MLLHMGKFYSFLWLGRQQSFRKGLVTLWNLTLNEPLVLCYIKIHSSVLDLNVSFTYV